MCGNREIIFVYNLFGLGGAQRRVSILANYLAENNYNIKIVALSGKEHPDDNVEFFPLSKKVELILLPEYIDSQKRKFKYKTYHICEVARSFFHRFMFYLSYSNNDRRTRYKKSLRGTRTSYAFRYYLKQHKNAIIIHFGFNVFNKTFYATRGLKNKIIFAETNAINKYMFDNNYLEIKEQVKAANGWVFQTQEERESFGLIESKNVVVIHNPITHTLPSPFIGERRKVIVTFCRMVPQKNLLLLCKAFSILHKEYPDYSVLIYADYDKSDRAETRDELDKYIRKEQLSDCITILPATPDVHKLVKDCEMFVSSSDYEGLSNSMIEAIAIGLPCVCTDCGGGGAREIITDGENGILTPVGDVEAMYRGMKRMIEDKSFAKKCSAYSDKLKKELSIESIGQKWLNLIEEIQHVD